MSENQEYTERRAARAIGFPCLSCGHQMAYSPAHGKLFCAYCRTEGEIESELTEAPEYLYFPDEDRTEAPRWEEMGESTLTCPSCGADTMMSATAVTATCPFCGSHYVTDTSEEKDTIRPETLVPFHIAREVAEESFHTWAKGRWLAPRAFRTQRHKTEMRGVYLPFFTFDSKLRTDYHGFGGRRRVVHYTVRVNGRTEHRTRTVIDWYPIRGVEHLDFDDMPCAATNKIDLPLFRRLGAYSMKTLNVYNPAYLAGFLAERYSIGLAEGFASVRPQMERRMALHIEASRGYDTYRGMQYLHHYDEVRFKHFLLPLWLATYRYRGKPYSFMVNGETGKAAGRAPLSIPKILLLSLCAIGAIALLLFLFSLGNG